MRTILGPSTNRAAVDIAAAGSLSVQVPVEPWDYLVKRLTIGGPINSIAKVYVGSSVSEDAFVDFSCQGWQDVAEYPDGLYVPQNTPLTVVWLDVTPPLTIFTARNITTALPGTATVRLEIDK